MSKKKIVNTGLALGMASSAFVAVSPVQGAEISAAEQAVASAEAAAKRLTPFYNVSTAEKLTVTEGFLKTYNDMKVAEGKALLKVAGLKDGKEKAELGDRLVYAQKIRLKAAYFIDAVKYGERLTIMKDSFRMHFSAGPTEEMRKQYDVLRKEIRRYELTVGKVANSSTRQAFGARYIAPAKIAAELAEFEMTRLDAHKMLAEAVDNQDKVLADRLLGVIGRLELYGKEKKKELQALYPSSRALSRDLAAIEKNIEVKLQNEKAMLIAALEEDLDEPFDLTIMHTNDTHANLDSAARRTTAVKEVRAQNEHALLLDAGDVFSGTLYFNEYKGQADLEFMNLMGYDAMTFGNHEFDLGTEPLARFVEKADFPFVSANVDFSKDANLKGRFNQSISSNPENGKIYTGIVKEVNGEKVGIFGLTTAETKDISSPGKDVAFEDYILQAKAEVDNFKKMGVDKIIALTHIGYMDGGGDNDAALAKAVDGIDVIVGGHSHEKLTAPVLDQSGSEPTVIVQANEYSKYLGTVNVEFDHAGKVISHDGKLIDINAYTDANGNGKADSGEYTIKEDAEAAKILNEKYKPAVEKLQNTIITSAEADLIGGNPAARTGETNLGNIITDGMLKKAQQINPDTVIALQNGGGIRTTIPKGDITVAKVLEVLPFGNSLGIMEIKGSELKAALEYSVKDAPKAFGGFLQVSGLKFTYNSSKPAGERVESVEVKGENGTFASLDETKMYTAATNVFTAKGGDGYSVFADIYADGRVSEPGFVDWEILSEYLKTKPQAKVEGRIVDTAPAAVK